MTDSAALSLEIKTLHFCLVKRIRSDSYFRFAYLYTQIQKDGEVPNFSGLVSKHEVFRE